MSVVVLGRVEGAAAGEPLLYDAELRIAGADAATHLKRGTIALTADDGTEIAVNTDRATVLVAWTEAAGKWGDLLAHPLSRPFDGQAPGDHVEVTLLGVAVNVGDRVAVLGGEGKRTHPRGQDAARGAKVARRTIDAMVIATGDDPDEVLSAWQRAEIDASEQAESQRARDEKRSAATPMHQSLPLKFPMLMIAAGVVAVAAGAAVLMGETGPRLLGAILPAWGIALSATGLYGVRRRRFLPTFDVVGGTTDGHALRWSSDASIIYLVIMVVGGGLSTAFSYGGLFPAVGVLYLIAAAGPPFLALHLLEAERKSVGILRHLVRTPAYRAGESGPRTLVVSLTDGGLTREYRATTRGGTGQRPVRRARQENRAETFELQGRIADGRVVHIHPGGAVFGSVAREAHYEKGDADLIGAVIEKIVPGHELLVLGRPKKSGKSLRVDSNGLESLVIFAAPTAPRRAARRALLTHYAATATLLLLGTAALALAWINPYMPVQTLTGEVTSVTGMDAVHVGDPCTLELADGSNGEPNSLACRARLTCGGVVLFGGVVTGYFDCTARRDDWETPVDADPRTGIRFIPPNHVEARPTDGRIVQLVIER